MAYYPNLIPSTKIHSFTTTKNTSLLDLLELPPLKNCQLAQMEQVHHNRFTLIDQTKPQTKQAKIYSGVDALITTQKKIILAVKTADCLPILFYHPKPLIGLIHAGRRGTMAKITQKVFNFAKHLLKNDKSQNGNNADNWQIWLGPAICADCYQINRQQDLHFDLKKHNLDQIKKELPDKKISLYQNNDCTACQNEQFYSYRKEGTSGRNWSLICLN